MKMFFKVAALAFFPVLLLFGEACANDKGVSAERMIAAIQTAVAANPGLIREVEVERDGGRLIIEVEMISPTGEEFEVKVDPEKNEVLR